MSSSPSALPLSEPLLKEEKRSPGDRFLAFLWLISILSREVPRQFVIWTLIAILQGLMPPFQLWASGQLVRNIQLEMDGTTAHPWLWVTFMALALASVRLLAPLLNWVEVAIHENGISTIHGRILSKTTEVDLALLEYEHFYNVTRRITEESNQSLKESLNALKAFITNVIPLVGTVVIIAAIDWRLMLVLLLPLIPIMAESLRQGGYVWNALRKQTHDRRIAQYIANRFSDRQSAKEIRLFGLAEELVSRWHFHYLHTRKEMRWKTTRAALRMQLSGTWADLLIYGGLIWLITGGLVEPSAADITILMGAFMTTGNQTFQLQQSLLQIGNQGGFAQDVRMFLQTPSIWEGTPSEELSTMTEPIILDKVTFAYPGTTTNVIDGISLTVAPGETIAIVGENGAGKSTLLKLMLGLYQPDSGSIRIGDRELQRIPTRERTSRMAAVFQTFGRYPESLRDNIIMPLDPDIERIDTR